MKVQWLASSPHKHSDQSSQNLNISPLKVQPMLREIQNQKVIKTIGNFDILLKKKRLLNNKNNESNSLITVENISTIEDYRKKHGFDRFIVLAIAPITFIEGISSSFKVQLYSESDHEEYMLQLEGDWAECTLEVGMVVNIIGTFNDKIIHVNNTNGMIVCNPDVLISATAVSESFQCTRSVIIKDRIKYAGQMNLSMLHGNLLHSLFQTAILNQTDDHSFLVQTLNIAIQESLEDIYALGTTEKQVFNQLQQEIELVREWYQKYMRPNKKNNNRFQILHATEVEQRLWSPKYGLKGNVDVTTFTRLQNKPPMTIPLELKTGKRQQISHRAQTQLYALMVADNQSASAEASILTYLKSDSKSTELGETNVIPLNAAEMRGLLIGRNKMATVGNGGLPPLIDNLNTCNRCYVAKECSIYRKAIEPANIYPEEVERFCIDNTKHLTATHLNFIQYWEYLLNIEEKSTKSTRQELWTKSIKERLKQGTCLHKLKIMDSKTIGGNKQFSTQYRMINSGGTEKFNESNIQDGDPIFITLYNELNPVAIGSVLQILADSVQIITDKELNKDRLYNIEKDEFSNGMAGIRGWFFKMFTDSGYSRLRDLIVDLKKPTFSEIDKSILEPVESQLNPDQSAALLVALSSQDYSLILGMPGTGKTTTIALLVKLLILSGKTVLLTSYTHSAVDNLLLKLMSLKIDFLRIGTESKMHPTIAEYTRKKKLGIDNIEKFSAVYDGARVVATTALGVNHKRRFDYCIVDESSQIALPLCLGPLQLANRWILVGDNYQLPPLFAQNAPLSKHKVYSLFERLSSAHPQAVAKLTLQYRMNEDILVLTNELTYDYRLKCGNDKIAKARMNLPFYKSLSPSLSQSSSWLRKIIGTQSVIFFNTDELNAKEKKTGPWIENPAECILVVKSVNLLIKAGLPASSIGIISPYRYQLKQLTRALCDFSQIELLTVDKFQGKDKKCILISFVRSNESRACGDLINDWRRVNVAITRAEQKLMMFGSVSTMSSSPSLAILIKLLRERGWIYDLKEGALNLIEP